MLPLKNHSRFYQRWLSLAAITLPLLVAVTRTTCCRAELVNQVCLCGGVSKCQATQRSHSPTFLCPRQGLTCSAPAPPLCFFEQLPALAPLYPSRPRDQALSRRAPLSIVDLPSVPGCLCVSAVVCVWSSWGGFCGSPVKLNLRKIPYGFRLPAL